MPGIHALTNWDDEAKTADCAECGPGVRIRVSYDRGYPHRRCHSKQLLRARRRVSRARDRGFAPLTAASLELEEALAAQGGQCLICRRKLKLVPDHCHVSGRFRGWLCAGCNLGLGHMGDDPQRLRAAAAYLEG